MGSESGRQRQMVPNSLHVLPRVQSRRCLVAMRESEYQQKNQSQILKQLAGLKEEEEEEEEEESF